MNGTLPNSPFATRFSGREGETRLRITNIVHGQHRRPAAVVLVLALVAILSCGWVFSFQARGRELTVVMETQYYDDQGNYIEIPAAATVGGGEAPGAAALNQALDELRTQYDLSIFLSTHDFATLEQYADKVILLKKQVLKAGKPEEVLACPEFYETFHLKMGKGGGQK